MSEIRTMLEETVNKVLKDYCTKELITEAEKGSFPRSLWETLDELGVTAVGIDDEIGGSGGDLGDLMALVKIAGYYAAPIPLTEHILSNWLLSTASLPIEQELMTFAPVTQEDTLHFLETNGGWSITGQANNIPWARDVKYLILYGKSSDNKLLFAKVPVEHCEIRHGENLAGEPRDQVVINHMVINKDQVKELASNDLNLLFQKATLSRVMLMTGALERTLDLSVTYTKERTQFGRSISKFQAIQQQLAILAGETTALMAVADYIMDHIDNTLSSDEVSMAKIQAGMAVEESARIAHQVHGAMGFTDEHPLHQSTRRLWSWRDEFGTETEHAEELGGKILSDYSENLWGYLTNPR